MAALLAAFRAAGADQELYLDRETGEIVGWSAETEELGGVRELRGQVLGDPLRFARIEPPPPEEQKQWAEQFTLSLPPGPDRGVLGAALMGRTPLRTFRAALEDSPGHRAHWLAEERRRLEAAILGWLAGLPGRG